MLKGYLSFWLVSLSTSRRWLHPCWCKWPYFILFEQLGNILPYIVPLLPHPFLCPWTFRLSPGLGYCEQCCYEHCEACMLPNHVFLDRRLGVTWSQDRKRQTLHDLTYMWILKGRAHRNKEKNDVKLARAWGVREMERCWPKGTRLYRAQL